MGLSSTTSSLFIHLNHVDTEDAVAVFEGRFAEPFLCVVVVCGQMHLHLVPNVFHRFSEHRIVHQFEEVFLKVVFSILPHVRVEVDVRLQPSGLLIADDCVNLAHLHPEPDDILQASVVYDVPFVVVEMGDELLLLGAWLGAGALCELPLDSPRATPPLARCSRGLAGTGAASRARLRGNAGLPEAGSP